MLQINQFSKVNILFEHNDLCQYHFQLNLKYYCKLYYQFKENEIEIMQYSISCKLEKYVYVGNDQLD